ncbi:MAG: hypothetical protein Q9225_001257 [Loekoesia sp. 1 TL-2023]
MTPYIPYSTLSAAAPEFVPGAYQNMPIIPTISEMKTFPTPQPNASSPSTTSTLRPFYDNQVPGIPTHWIPIYGAGHGIFYDPITKLFHGDGDPRPTLERPDGSMQPMDNSITTPAIGSQTEDLLHLQQPWMTRPIVREVENGPNAVRRYYCRCRDAWLEYPHDCPLERRGEEMLEDRVRPLGRIRPGDVIPLESITHDLAVGDLSYLTSQQRFAYEHGLPMLMPSVAGGMGMVPPNASMRGGEVRIWGGVVGGREG